MMLTMETSKRAGKSTSYAVTVASQCLGCDTVSRINAIATQATAGQFATQAPAPQSAEYSD